VGKFDYPLRVLQVWVYSQSSPKVWEIMVDFLSRVGLGGTSFTVKAQMGYNGNMGSKNAIRGVWMLNVRKCKGF
jgi:hypothetical protein